MLKARTLPYIIIFLISPIVALSQLKADEWRHEGPRVGLDLSRFLVPSFQKASRSAWEIQADIPYKGNLFPTFEMGMQWFEDNRTNFDYKNNGTYGRIGIDVNILKFESLKDGDLVFVGTRYGYSRFKHSANNITYGNYWGTLEPSIPERNMNAHWAELVFGIKGEIMRNLFLGWSFRAKFLITKTKDPNIDPYIIPGIGKMSGDIPFDFSFGVYYRFPIFRTKTIPKPIQIGGSEHLDDEENLNKQGNGSGGGVNMRNLKSGSF